MKEIIARYRKVFEGKTWYGKNISESLQAVPPNGWLARIDHSYNIVELVLHMMAWRNYVVDLVVHRKHREVPETENFPTVTAFSDEQWVVLMQSLAESQEKVLQTLARSELKLDSDSPRAGYTWADIFEGLIHHDIYHSGQINVLRKYASTAS